MSDGPHKRASLNYHFIVWDHILDLPLMPWDDEVLLLEQVVVIVSVESVKAGTLVDIHPVSILDGRVQNMSSP
jgi:hypothetical protein